MLKKYAPLWLSIGFVLVSVLYLMLGEQNYSLAQLASHPIVLQVRLPRLLGTIFVGVLVSVAGLLMQVLTGNPIAEMSTLGVSNGASVALAILLVLKLPTSPGLAMLVGMVGAAVALIAVVLLTLKRRFDPLRIILVGVSVGMFSAAIASSLTYYTQNAQAYFMWLVGSMSGLNYDKTVFLGVSTLVMLVVTMLFSKPFKLLSFGDELATSLGVNVTGTRLVIIILVVLASGVTVSSVGVIAFLGLIAPHIAGYFSGQSFLKRLALTSLVGALILVVSDLLARNLFKPYEFPVGSLTMLLGAPFFLYLVGKGAKRES
jgi:iron complex transport system permease protein